jgi:hypothetical protein
VALHLGSRMRRPGSNQKLRCEAALAVLALLFSGCYGDFGRPRPSIFGDGRAAAVSSEAALQLGEAPSLFPFTDDERLLRELAFPLIRPPYGWVRWNAVIAEAVRGGVYYEAIDEAAIYAARLLSFPFRSATGRYGRLIDDIGSDIERIDPFLEVARRVADMDRKREKSLAYVSSLSAGEAANAAVRVGENSVILAWVQRCLGEHARSYRIALERLVIATPAPIAVEAERAVIDLERRVATLYAGMALRPAGAAVIAK